jgi:hypothetical protein
LAVLINIEITILTPLHQTAPFVEVRQLSAYESLAAGGKLFDGKGAKGVIESAATTKIPAIRLFLMVASQ